MSPLYVPGSGGGGGTGGGGGGATDLTDEQRAEVSNLIEAAIVRGPRFAAVVTALQPGLWFKMDDANQAVKTPPWQMTDSSGNGRHGLHNADSSGTTRPVLRTPGLIHDDSEGYSATYARAEDGFSRVSTSYIDDKIGQHSWFMRAKFSSVAGGSSFIKMGQTWQVQVNDGLLNFWYYLGGGSWATRTFGTVIANAEYSMGISRDASRTKLYFNGLMVVDDNLGLLSNPGDLWLGEDVDGSLDEFCYWTGRALTDASQSSLHNAAVGV